MFTEYRRLGDILLRKGLINEERLAQALASQKLSGSRLGDILAAMEWVTQEDVARALAEQYEFTYIDVESVEPEHDALKKVTGRWSLAKLILPIAILDGRLEVAISDPIDVDSTDELRGKIGMPVDVVVACPTALRNAIIRAYTMDVDTSPKARKGGRKIKIDQQADRIALIGALDRLFSGAA